MSTRPTAGGCGFCTGLGTTLRGGIVHVLAVDAGERRLGHAADGDLETLEPLLALLAVVDAEPAELGLG